jgi:hypothetical protein
MLRPLLPRQAHDIGEALQLKIEALEEVKCYAIMPHAA